MVRKCFAKTALLVVNNGGNVSRYTVSDGMCGVRIVFWLLAFFGWVSASEFPERECCDLEYPPQLLSTVSSSSVATTTLPGIHFFLSNNNQQEKL